MKFACDEAKKQAEKGAHSACIDDAVVYGWAIHYFEEDSIEGTLYNEDDTEYKPQNSAAKQKPAVPSPLPAPKPKPQMSLFDMLDNNDSSGISAAQSDDEDEEPNEEEKQEVLAELAERNGKQKGRLNQSPQALPSGKTIRLCKANTPIISSLTASGTFTRCSGLTQNCSQSPSIFAYEQGLRTRRARAYGRFPLPCRR